MAQRTAGKSTVQKRRISRKAEEVLVGGVNSPVRTFHQTGGEPLILKSSKGASVTGVDGKSYVDFIMGWGAVILGHNPPGVVQAIRRGLGSGVLMGLTHPSEIELAGLVAETVPSVEQVRFTVSGTEACLTAVRLARGITRRSKILSFDGGYHGHGESVIAHKSAGGTAAIDGQVLRAPYNDAEAVARLLRQYGGETACVIVEPVAANMGVVPPGPSFLSQLRDITRSQGILLIFDEVVTGFRLAVGGAQERFGVKPDLSTFGKIIGGGLPVGAVGGPRELMRYLTPEGPVFHGGTFSGHPLAMAAGVAAIRELRSRRPYARLERSGAQLEAGLREAAEDAGVPVWINRVGSMLTVFFSDRPIRNQAQAKVSRLSAFGVWAESLRAQGILIPPSPFEAIFLSTAHSQAQLSRFVRAARIAFGEVAQGMPI